MLSFRLLDAANDVEQDGAEAEEDDSTPAKGGRAIKLEFGTALSTNETENMLRLRLTECK